MTKKKKKKKKKKKRMYKDMLLLHAFGDLKTQRKAAPTTRTCLGVED